MDHLDPVDFLYASASHLSIRHRPSSSIPREVYRFVYHYWDRDHVHVRADRPREGVNRGLAPTPGFEDLAPTLEPDPYLYPAGESLRHLWQSRPSFRLPQRWLPVRQDVQHPLLCLQS